MSSIWPFFPLLLSLYNIVFNPTFFYLLLLDLTFFRFLLESIPWRISLISLEFLNKDCSFLVSQARASLTGMYSPFLLLDHLLSSFTGIYSLYFSYWSLHLLFSISVLYFCSCIGIFLFLWNGQIFWTLIMFIIRSGGSDGCQPLDREDCFFS